MGNCCSRGNSEIPDTNEQEASVKNDTNGPNSSSREDSFCNTPPAQQEAPSAQSSGASSKRNRPNIGSVLCRPMEDVRKTYDIKKELGRGQFGVTYLCTHKAKGEQFACKTIAKRKLTNKEDIEDVRREVQIMHHLTGQPNIVELKCAYEDRHSVHLVMELCTGGELFDRIIAKGNYTERAAASLLRTIVQTVHTCHSMGVFHRDLKPENFLLLNQEENSPLKATDFGLSLFYKPGDVFKDIVGNAYYIAPEVLQRKYGPEADIWSIGVMLYILLSGVPPFWAENENGIFQAILRGNIDVSSDPWPSISPQAKDLVTKMLTLDHKQRLTAQQVLNHPWIKEDGEAPDTPLDCVVLARLKQFKAMNNFKKVAMRVVAGCLSEEEIRGMKEMFKGMDTDNSGTITLEELKQCLAKQGTKITESEIKQLMEAADADGTRTIDYEEFITAIMRINRMDREEHLYQAFQHFDKDDSGYITTEELEQALREYGMHDGENIKEIISEVDSDNEGRINYYDFATMIRKGNPEMHPKKRRDDKNEWISVPKFGGWDHKDPASTNYSEVFSQARANRKQRRDVWRSLGNELDLAAASLRHDNQDSFTANKKQHETAVGATDNSMSMSRGQPDRKQLKTKVSHTLGNEQEFAAAALAPHRQDNDNDPAVSKRSMLVPEFGGWDRKAPGSVDYTIEFSQARAIRKQHKSDVRHSLGNDRDFIAVPSPQSQPPRQDNNQDSPVATNARKRIPEFGGWDQVDAGSLGYTMVFSQARDNRKQQKSDVWSSLGSEQDFFAVPSPQSQSPRQNNNQDSSVATNARKSVPEFGGWDGVEAGSLGYTMEFYQTGANRKQQKSDVRSSLGSGQDFIAVPLPQSQPSRQDNNQDSPVATNAQKTVPEFRGWDGVDPGSLGYTMEFSQARASRKKQKSDARSSLGSEQDLIAVPLPQSHPSRQDNNQDSSAATNARKSIPEFGGWDRVNTGSLGYKMEFSQARANRKQQKSDVRTSLGSEQDLFTVPSPRLQPPRQDNYQDSFVATNAWKTVPEFGGWDRVDARSLGYTMEFSQARANRKQRKSDVRSSLGSERDFIAALSPRQPVTRQLPYRQDKNVSKRKKILTYITRCLRP
ncbi:hypothetical protein V6N12_009111 [Hibiscus sabdariffa]|uniref:non-specific serine/threonine protein kinase n=1 Tax=Hibiscus sabdariffa TaxID=183260 RepID=A0ABR2C4Q9_9ROSI